jgi:hypothetical protein
MSVFGERDSPKVNVFCAISEKKVCGLFFSVENTIMGNSHLDMLILLLLPQLEKDSDNIIFQQDGSPPHFHTAVWNHQNAHIPQRWIGCAGASDVVWCS